MSEEKDEKERQQIELDEQNAIDQGESPMVAEQTAEMEEQEVNSREERKDVVHDVREAEEIRHIAEHPEQAKKELSELEAILKEFRALFDEAKSILRDDPKSSASSEENPVLEGRPEEAKEAPKLHPDDKKSDGDEDKEEKEEAGAAAQDKMIDELEKAVKELEKMIEDFKKKMVKAGLLIATGGASAGVEAAAPEASGEELGKDEGSGLDSSLSSKNDDTGEEESLEQTSSDDAADLDDAERAVSALEDIMDHLDDLKNDTKEGLIKVGMLAAGMPPGTESAAMGAEAGSAEASSGVEASGPEEAHDSGESVRAQRSGSHRSLERQEEMHEDSQTNGADFVASPPARRLIEKLFPEEESRQEARPNEDEEKAKKAARMVIMGG